MNNENNNSTIDVEKIQNLFRKINTCDVHNIFNTENTKNENEISRKSYKDIFQNFAVSYEHVKDIRGGSYNRTELSFIDNSKKTKLAFWYSRVVFTDPSSSGDYYCNFGIKQKNEFISNENFNAEMIEKCSIVEPYLNHLLVQFQVLEIAEKAQRQIHGILHQKITDISAVDSMKEFLECDGYKAWFNNGSQLDKKDGPAIENYNGRDFWFSNGKPYLPKGIQVIQYSDDNFREYDNGVLIKDTGVECNDKETNLNSIVLDVINKFRKIIPSNKNKNTI